MIDQAIARYAFQTERPASAQPVRNGDSVSLRGLAIRGVVWTVAGFGLSQVIRLGANVLVARLLFPRAFGLMALVRAFLYAAEMLSDVGLRGSVIHHRRADEASFLNTAWTMQVLRGHLLWLVTLAAAIPAAYFYDQPMLVRLLPIAGLTVLINGYASMRLLSANRHLDVRWLTKVDLASQLAGILGLIGLAWLTRSLWSLVVGAVVSSLVRALLSHPWSRGQACRFQWDRSAAADLVRFGRWTALSSVMTFVTNQGDVVILGSFLTTSQLGMYSLAAALAMLPWHLFDRLGAYVLQPVYARIASRGILQIRVQARRIRLSLMLALFPYLGLLYLFSHGIFDWLYDQRYSGAAWFCRLLCLRVMFRMATDAGPAFLAFGQSHLHLGVTVIRSISLLAGMLGGGVLAGGHGVVWGIAVSPLIGYPLQCVLYRRWGLWQPEVDGVGLGATFLLCALVASGS